MNQFITLTKESIDNEHICCAISDKKCVEGYQAKKAWLKTQFDHGYLFRRIDDRAKVFIEYGPAEYGWAPVDAPGYLLVNCFWVSGKYKGNGYGKHLLELALDDARKQEKHGLVTVAGTKKFHFMSDTKWLLGQGFTDIERTRTGFSLLVRKLNDSAPEPAFRTTARDGKIEEQTGLVAYYSNRCPFAEYHVTTSLTETAKNRGLPLKTVKLETLEQAQSAPSPATIFSLFREGEFITTDISVCMDSRFDKIMAKH